MDFSLSKSEAKGIIKRHSIKKWQHSWDNRNTGRQHYAVQQEVGTVSRAERHTKEVKILTIIVLLRTYQT